MKNKILSIFCIFFIICMFFTSNVFANYDDITYSFNREDLINWASQFGEYNNGGYYHIIVDNANTPNSSCTCYVIFINKELYDNNDIDIYLTYENGLYYINFTSPIQTCETWNGSSSMYVGYGDRTKSTCGFAPSSVDGNVANLTFTTDLDVVYKDSNLNSFFFQTPVEILTLEGMKVETIPQMIMKILKIVLPVCLVTFGTLLVVFLIKSKNLLKM